jgi:hypothetical protein
MAVAISALALGLVALLAPGIDLDPDQPFAGLLSQCCTVVLLGCAGWAWLVTVVVLLEAVATPTDERPPPQRRGLPSAYRRLVLGACGLALSAGVTAPALATPGPIHLDPRPATAATTTSHQVARAPMQAPPAARAAREIVVRHGDSLWHLAAERLPRDASDATITHTWKRLYAANSSLIGTDPDHIEPGQHLEQPQGW